MPDIELAGRAGRRKLSLPDSGGELPVAKGPKMAEKADFLLDIINC
jgi:hypothetical protein